jgi:hypothetical protein
MREPRVFSNIRFEILLAMLALWACTAANRHNLPSGNVRHYTEQHPRLCNNRGSLP